MQSKVAKIYKRLVKALLWITMSLLFLLLLIVIVIQVPRIQYIAVNGIITAIESGSEHRIEIGSVDIDWFDAGTLHDVVLYDFQDHLMFKANTVHVDFDLLDLYSDRRLSLDKISIDTASFFLRKYNDSTSINFSVFLKSLNKEPKEEPLIISTDQLEISQLELKYDHDLRPFMSKPRFDYNHFAFNINDFILQELLIKSGEIHADLTNFMGIDQSGLEIEEFLAKIHFTQQSLMLKETRIQTPHSTIGDQLNFHYSTPSNLGYIIDSVRLEWQLRDAVIGHEDLKYFSELKKWNEKVLLNADLSGTISRLVFKNTRVLLEDNSSFYGNVEFIGLPDWRNTFIDLSVQNAKLIESRALSFFGDTPINPGELQFSGSLIGFINDFVATGDFITRGGKVYSDLNLKLTNDLSEARYIGKLRLLDFHVNDVTSINTNLILDFNGRVDGKGLTKNSADFNLDAEISDLKYGKYQFDSFTANGRFKSNFFAGSVNLTDDEINIDGNAKIDFSVPQEVIEVDIRVDSVDLYSLGLSRKPIKVSTDIDIDLHDLNVNDATGNLRLQNIQVIQEGDSIEVDAIEIVSSADVLKTYSVFSPDFQFTIQGNFRITDLIKDLPRTVREYRNFFTEEYSQIVEYYDTAIVRNEYYADFQLKAANLGRYLDFIGIPADFSGDLEMEISYQQRSDVNFNFFMEVDTFKLGNRIFSGNSVEVNASKDLDSLGVLALIYLASDKQVWDVVSTTEKLVCESIWNNNNLDLGLSLKQPNNNNEAKINADIDLRPDSISIRFYSSLLKAFDRPWTISSENEILFLKDKILINDLQLYNQDQSIKADGVISDSLVTLVEFDFENFELKNISAVLPKSFDGVLNGKARVTRINGGDPVRFESQSTIDSLQFENILVGNLSGRSSWDRDQGGIIIDYQLENANIETVKLDGLLRPFDPDNQVDLKARFNKANFNVIEPFFSSLVSNVSGFATGEVVVKGRLQQPLLEGGARLENGNVTLNYLNTTYTFEGNTTFKENAVIFENFKVTDRFQNNASVQGELQHKYFKDFQSNIQVAHESFELLNTTISQNDLYYGNAYSTGTIELTGPISNILIKGDVTTGPNTRIYIPFTDDSEVQTQDYIKFISKTDTTISVDFVEPVDLRGINLDFNVNVTNDAYSELIFDPRTGDIIRGRGTGNLQLTTDSDGNFELFGSLEVSEGAYNFTTSFINKEFQLKPGGTIKWYGDPYGGQLDLEATYRQLADPNDWRSSFGDDNEVSQKAPVLVNLGLTGPMMSPTIDFKLELEEQSSSGFGDQSNWRTLIAAINSNEEELKRQVFSLLILRKFTEEESFVVSGNNVIGSSVSEFVSNQLSYWLNQVDENLEISIDLGTLDQDALNTFQLRLAYTFLDGRLRISKDGVVTRVVEEGNTNLANSILGDWSIEYLLSVDGKLRVKVFSKTDQTLATQSEMNQQPGVSIRYVQSFDELKEFFGLNNKEEKRDQASAAPIPPGNFLKP